MSETTKLHLRKPDLTDTFSLENDLNANWDKIDNAVGTANGIASLDSSGRIPYSQLPESAMEFKGSWNASTNTPTLVDGTGTKGDFYVCTVEGDQFSTHFYVNDRVIYNGSNWERLSSGEVRDVQNPSGTSLVTSGIAKVPVIDIQDSSHTSILDSATGIATLPTPATAVQDVKIDGNSIVSDGIASISTNVANGLLKLNSSGKIANGVFPSIGSTTTPIWINSSGNIGTCPTYGGGTAVTLNGSSKAGATASFYAPTSSGTSGEMLVSQGSGSSPAWVTAPALYLHNIKLTLSTTTYVSVQVYDSSNTAFTSATFQTYLNNHKFGLYDGKYLVAAGSTTTSNKPVIGIFYYNSDHVGLYYINGSATATTSETYSSISDNFYSVF